MENRESGIENWLSHTRRSVFRDLVFRWALVSDPRLADDNDYFIHLAWASFQSGP